MTATHPPNLREKRGEEAEHFGKGGQDEEKEEEENEEKVTRLDFSMKESR